MTDVVHVHKPFTDAIHVTLHSHILLSLILRLNGDTESDLAVLSCLAYKAMSTAVFFLSSKTVVPS